MRGTGKSALCPDDTLWLTPIIGGSMISLRAAGHLAPVLVLVVASPALAQFGGGCRIPTVAFCHGCETTVTFTVQSGGTCTLAYQGGRMRGRTIFGHEVILRPRGGSVGSANETLVAYQARPGFRGKDTFKLRIYYDHRDKKTFTILNATADVVDRLP
jgi:hypothetical protein